VFQVATVHVAVSLVLGLVSLPIGEPGRATTPSIPKYEKTKNSEGVVIRIVISIALENARRALSIVKVMHQSETMVTHTVEWLRMVAGQSGLGLTGLSCLQTKHSHGRGKKKFGRPHDGGGHRKRETGLQVQRQKVSIDLKFPNTPGG